MTFSRPRILTYSHDGVGLGHLRRNLRLINALLPKVPDASVLMVTGSAASSSFQHPAHVDNLKLPSLAKVANDHYVSHQLGLDRAAVSRLRSSLLVAAVVGYEPDLVLIDFYPLGVQGELTAALRILRERSPTTPIILGWRDILDSPEQVRREWVDTGQIDAIGDLYDKVLLYGCQEIYDPIVEYALPAAVAERMCFTGYLLDPSLRPPPSEPGQRRPARRGKRGPAVVCTLGGGEDGQTLAWGFLAAMEHLRPKGWTGILVTGPLMAAGDRAALGQAAERQGVTCRTFVAELPALVAGADVVVAMAGYNTVCEVLAAGTPAVLVPRVDPRAEQLLRANVLSARGLARTLVPAEITGPRLAATIEEQALSGRSEQVARVANSLNIDGLSNASNILASAFREPVAVAQ
jgi:predicted glycosyltransferase